MDIKNEIEKIKQELLNNDIYTDYSILNVFLKNDKEDNYFDYFLRFSASNGLSDYKNLYAFLTILKKSGFKYYEELAAVVELYNFFGLNRKNNISLKYNQAVVAFNVLENIIYLHLPLNFKKGVEFSKSKSENNYYFENINIMIKDNVFYVGEKRVKNLKNYLMYEYIKSYKKLMKVILPEINIIDYSLSDIDIIHKCFENNNKLIELLNY